MNTLPKRPADLRRSENGLLIDGEGMSYAPHMESFAPGNQAKLLSAHEHAVAMRAVEALRAVLDQWEFDEGGNAETVSGREALAEIAASGWVP